LPNFQRQTVKFAGDEDFQRGAFFHGARVVQQLRGEIGQLLFLRALKCQFLRGIRMLAFVP
jgi:hypothetical protein